MSTKSAILTFSLLLLMAAGVVVGVVLVRQNQDPRSRAESGTQTTNEASLSSQINTANAQENSCTTPAQVNNVSVNYPDCGEGVGSQCSFDQASCTFDASSDASSYAITITEVESNHVVKQETISSASKYTFPVTPNHTYRCDVSAVNACGTIGPVGTAQALCATDGAVATPAPTVAPVVVATPAPVVKVQYACGKSCTSSADCQSGLTCVKVAGGEAYCAVPAYQSACVSNPTIASCCQAPVELPKSGLLDETINLSLFGTLATVLGLGGAVFAFRRKS